MDAVSAAGPDRDAESWTTNLVGWAVLAELIATTRGSQSTKKQSEMRCILNETVYSQSWLHNSPHFGVFFDGCGGLECIPRGQMV
jgi:hypothetical protein